MSTVKGIVEFHKKEVKSGAKGTFHKNGLKIAGEWYNLNGNKESPDYSGKLVTFEFTPDNYGNKIDPKTFSASATAAVETHTGGPKTKALDNQGVKIGHAISVAAVLFAVLSPEQRKFNTVKGLAIKVLELGHELNNEYADLVESFELQGDEEVVAQDEPAAAPVSAPAAPAATKKAAATKAAPKAQVAAAPAPAASCFEDDIPF